MNAVPTKRLLSLGADLLKYGYYMYDGALYVTKSEALDAALAKSDLDPDVKFLFHDDLFGKIDWRVEPTQTLPELYAMRARQLRETYDYLILQYSGGVDSHTILQTFIDAEIHIDEVQSYWPTSVLDKITPVADVDHPLGGMFEYQLVVKPTLERLAKTHPRTKISVIDTAQYIRQNWNEEFLARNAADMRFCHTLILGMKHYQTIEHVNAMSETLGKQRIGVIFGAERPRPYVTNRGLCFQFFDVARTGFNCQTYQADARRFSPEMFYWTRDLPLIPIKQMHMIRRAMETDPELFDSIVNPEPTTGLGDVRRRSEGLINRIIYPTWDPSTYQKRVKNQDDQIVNYILEAPQHENETGLRDATWINPFADYIIDLRMTEFLRKYGRFSSRAGFEIIRSEARPDWYNVRSLTGSRVYSVGPVHRKFV